MQLLALHSNTECGNADLTGCACWPVVLSLPHLLPRPFFRRIHNRIEHQLRPIGVAEVGHGWFAGSDAFEEVRDLMDERMLVANLQAGNPPFVHVGMIGAVVRDMDRFPAAQLAIAFLVIVNLQPMQIVQIPEKRRVFAIDFKRVERLVAARVAGRFERSERAIREAAHEHARVVDANLFHLAGESVRTFLHERLGRGGKVFDRSR